ncbi:MAG: DUF3243 domain-containing protein [Gorillibacterium sp.]|nr:DUF3243 domain-containing protein [Gorillibacterium sp.]
MATVLKSYDKWKSFLSDRVSEAERLGFSDEFIVKMAKEIGDFLSNKIDPENPEERAIKELWDVGDEQERKTLARLMFKLVK